METVGDCYVAVGEYGRHYLEVQTCCSFSFHIRLAAGLPQPRRDHAMGTYTRLPEI